MRLCPFLFLLIIFICPVINGFADESIRFAVVSDLHIGKPGAAESTARVVEDINADQEIDFVVFLGDITEDGMDSEFAAAYDIISRLDKPYYVLTGNHDTKAPESGWDVFRRYFGSERFWFTHKGYYFAGIPSGPYTRDTRASFLAEDTGLWEEASDLPLIFFTHHPLQEVSNIKELSARGGPAPLIAFGGHLHENSVREFKSIVNIICCSSLSTEQRENRYNIVTISGSSLSVTCRNARGDSEKQWYTTELNQTSL